MEPPPTPTAHRQAPRPPPPPVGSAPPPPSALASPPPVPFGRPGGQLTRGWRTVTGIVWGFAFVGFVAVWKTSRELGLNTWWLGPFGDPVFPLISMLPFTAPLLMVLFAVNNAKGLPWLGLAAAAATAVIAAFDIGKVPRLGLVEMVIAGAGALTAVAGLSGRSPS